MFDVTEVESEEEPWRGRTVCIDFDEVAYKSASGNETRGIRVRKNKPFAMWREWSTRTEFYAHIGGKKNAGDYTIEDVQYPFRIEKAFNKVDEAVRDAMQKCDTDEMIGYMGSGSPRDFIATVDVYKGQRADMIRPVQLKEVRQYCIDKWGAIEVDGTKYEADDMLAIEGVQNGAIQATQDKDSWHVEGYTLSPNWDTPRWTGGYGYVEVNRDNKTPKMVGTGLCMLVGQIITSDSADNWFSNKLSDKRFGLVGAVKLINQHDNPTDLWNAVAEHYQWLYPEPVEYNHAYSGEPMVGTWHSLLAEYYSLAKMKFSLDEKPNVYRDVLDKYGIDYEGT